MSVIACAALMMRLRKTWLISPMLHVTGGNVPRSSSTSATYLYSLRQTDSVVSIASFKSARAPSLPDAREKRRIASTIGRAAPPLVLVDRLGTIRISSGLEDGEAVIRIADDGPGIPLDLQGRIYEPFFTKKEIGRGSGQGLALARTTVEQHGGSLECTSEPGHGATFTIRLPVGPIQAPVTQVPTAV
jgi:hypothetical protein